jgi:hypothetical protein
MSYEEEDTYTVESMKSRPCPRVLSESCDLVHIQYIWRIWRIWCIGQGRPV